MIQSERIRALVYRSRLTLAAAAFCFCALTALLLPWSRTRDIELHITVQNAGPAWELDWSPGLSSLRQGHWIDLSERLHANARTVSQQPQTLVLRERLADYWIGDIALRWHDSPGAKLTIDDAFADDSILSLAHTRTHLKPTRLDGALPLATSLPLNATCMTNEGGVYFDAPTAPIALPLAAAVSLAITSSTYFFIAALWKLAGAYDRRLSRSAPRQRKLPWLTAAAITTSVAIPLWMLSWSPMIVSGDGIEYIQLAASILRAHSLEGFDGWRLPGYAALLVPFMAASPNNFITGLGWAHAAMAIATPLLAWDILRRRCAAPWPQLAAILIAIDPALIIWQRTALTECQTTFLITLSAWLFLKVQRVPLLVTKWRSSGVLAATLGLTLAAACYTRPNLQVFALLAPVALFAARPKDVGPRTQDPGLFSRLKPALICALTTAAALSPLVLHNLRTFSTPALVVGSDWSRAVWSWEDGLMDWNQSGTFTFDQYRQLRTMCEKGEVTSWTFPDIAQRWQTPAAPRDLHPRTQTNIRAAALWHESAARRADLYLKNFPRAFASLMGWPMKNPPINHGDTRFLIAPLIADPTHCPDHTNWLTGFDKPDEPALAATVRPLGNTAESWQARTLRTAFNTAAALRPAITAAFLFSIIILIRRREWPMVALALILLAHMAGVSLLVFCGNDRYAMPWYGLMTLIAVAGLASSPSFQSKEE